MRATVANPVWIGSLGSSRFSRATQERVVREGHEAWRLHGPARECPYSADERNGIWCFGAQQAKAGYSISRAILNFKRMEHP